MTRDSVRDYQAPSAGQDPPPSEVAYLTVPEWENLAPPPQEPTVIVYLRNSQDLRALILGLPAHHLRVVGSSTFEGFTEALRTQTPDVVLVEFTPPAGNAKGAKDLVGLLTTTQAPIIVLVDEDKLQKGGFLSETADFLIKPFSFAEAVARIGRILRQRPSRKMSPARLAVGDLELDLTGFRAWIKGKEIHLSYKEFELLRYLALNERHVVSRSDLLRDVWGYNFTGSQRTVDVHIRRLRVKLVASTGCAIETVVNVGYKFVRTWESA